MKVLTDKPARELHGLQDFGAFGRWGIEVSVGLTLVTDEPKELFAALMLREMAGLKPVDYGFNGFHLDEGFFMLFWNTEKNRNDNSWQGNEWLWHYHGIHDWEIDWCSRENGTGSCPLQRLIEEGEAEYWDEILKIGGVQEYVRIRYIEAEVKEKEKEDA